MKRNELNEAIKQTKNGKASGHDLILTEVIKNLGEHGRNWLLQLCNKAQKKGDRKDCQNYRGITVSSVVAKIYKRILATRLTKKTESKMQEEQSAFRKGRSVEDHLFTLKQTITKIRQKKREAWFVFVDLEKAFICPNTPTCMENPK